jgi:hypothetical protein
MELTGALLNLFARDPGYVPRLIAMKEKLLDLTPVFGPPVMRVCGRWEHAIGGRRLLGFGS